LPLIGGDEEVASLEMLKHLPQNKKMLEGLDHPYTKHLEQKRQQSAQTKRQYPGMKSISSHHSSSHQYSNINGDVVSNSDQKDQVAEDGALVAAYHQANLRQAPRGKQPNIQELREVDLPEENIHKKVLNQNGKTFNLDTSNQISRNPSQLETVKRNSAQQQQFGFENQFSNPEQNDKLVTAEELSRYIVETGDEQGVADYFQQLIMDGQLGEYEALDYLNLIKSILSAQNESVLETEREQEREREAQMILDFSDYLDAKYQNGEIPSHLYRGLKGKLMESVIERAAADPQFLAEPQRR